MAPPTEDQLTKVSTEAATNFVRTFYPALQSNRDSISSFYSETPAKILFNGNTVADGKAVQDIFTNQMPVSYYEVQSFDCQIINRSYPTPTPTGPKQPDQRTVKDMSILVVVSGSVRYGDRDPAKPQRGFSETFVLVPNATGGDHGKGRRSEYLIEDQNFRLVV
ncbi:hypothetical protein N7468_006620 [Penicillium chermesinum]|uniref:NTF2 domain-containing protein n=1 Tax=Penicillium chermesinum TaxID=63820 RepID=A0A9W9TLC1_9EURO|nr:uncharacterized protein N7468_006620 [Penicillium chermesinum]KAJ5225395.1 hypothetical protein N7468_006620 [Penicillium chermesinum]KAJ6161379.1 hypothetical protein N7470_004775 [Penicillium chermesinum]